MSRRARVRLPRFSPPPSLLPSLPPPPLSLQTTVCTTDCRYLPGTRSLLNTATASRLTAFWNRGSRRGTRKQSCLRRRFSAGSRKMLETHGRIRILSSERRSPPRQRTAAALHLCSASVPRRPQRVLPCVVFLVDLAVVRVAVPLSHTKY